MFGTISAAIRSLWSKKEDPLEDLEEKNDSHDHVAAEAEDPSNPGTVLEKQFDGKVTSLYCGYGLIDNDAYFDFDVVKGALPRVGDTVHVVANRKHEAAGWRCVKVLPFPC